MTTENKAEATVDYKAELDKAKEELAKKNKELDQARFTLTKKNLSDKEKKTEKKIFDTADYDNDTQPDINEVIDERARAIVTEQKAQDFLSKHSSNPEEVELAKFHLENTIRASGNPEADAIAALAIANQKTVLKQKEELKTALLNKNQNLQTSSFASSDTKIEVNEFSKYLTSEQLSTLRSVHKFSDEQIRLFLQKKLARPM